MMTRARFAVPFFLCSVVPVALFSCGGAGNDDDASTKSSSSKTGTAKDASGDTTHASSSHDIVKQSSEVAEKAIAQGKNEWIVIPSGTFDMGTSLGEKQNKKYSRVTLSAFAIQILEVSAKDYEACVAAQKCDPPATFTGCTYGVKALANHPINCVSWDGARNYCTYVGGDLPTEAQWEYAARGTTKGTYPWGDGSPSKRANCLRDCEDPYAATAPRGDFSKGKSSFGVYDMSGNVAEWTLDYFKSNFWEECRINPQGCRDRWNSAPEATVVVRGGSYEDFEGVIQCATRTDKQAVRQEKTVGFRCIRPLTAEEKTNLGAAY